MEKAALDILLGSIPQRTQPLQDLWVLRSLVVARSGRLGVSGTWNPEPTHLNPGSSCDSYEQYLGRPAGDVARELLQSTWCLDRSVGLACLDSVIELPDSLIQENATRLLRGRIEDKYTCFVGHFPRADRWRAEGRRVDVVEMEPLEGDVPWEQADDVLARAEVLFITGKTLVNGTLGDVIRRSPNARYRILLGPSAILCERLLSLGLDVIGATMVRDEQRALRWWQLGGFGMRRAPEGSLSPACIVRPGLL